MAKPTLIFATFLATTHHKTYQYIMDFIERVTEIPTFLLCGESLDDFADGYIDGGFVSGLSYLQLSKLPSCPVDLITAIPMDLYPQMKSTFSEIVVRKDSQFRTINDLHRCVWAYHEKFLSAGYAFSVYDREDQKLLGDAIGGVIESRSHAQTLRFLLEGQADVAVIDSAMLDLVLYNSPQLADQLHILDSFGPALLPPIVLSSHVDPVLKQTLQTACLAMAQDPFLMRQLQADFLHCVSYHHEGCIISSSASGFHPSAIETHPIQEVLASLPDFVH